MQVAYPFIILFAVSFFLFGSFSVVVSQSGGVSGVPPTCVPGEVLVLVSGVGLECQSAEQRLLSLNHIQDSTKCPDDSLLIVADDGTIDCVDEAVSTQSISNAVVGECDLGEYRNAAGKHSCTSLPLNSSTIDCFAINASGDKIYRSSSGNYVTFRVFTGTPPTSGRIYTWYEPQGGNNYTEIATTSSPSLTRQLLSSGGNEHLAVGIEDVGVAEVRKNCSSISI